MRSSTNWLKKLSASSAPANSYTSGAASPKPTGLHPNGSLCDENLLITPGRSFGPQSACASHCGQEEPSRLPCSKGLRSVLVTVCALLALPLLLG